MEFALSINGIIFSADLNRCFEIQNVLQQSKEDCFLLATDIFMLFEELELKNRDVYFDREIYKVFESTGVLKYIQSKHPNSKCLNFLDS